MNNELEAFKSEIEIALAPVEDWFGETKEQRPSIQKMVAEVARQLVEDRNENLRQHNEIIEMRKRFVAGERAIEALKKIASLDYKKSATNLAAFNAVTLAKSALAQIPAEETK